MNRRPQPPGIQECQVGQPGSQRLSQDSLPAQRPSQESQHPRSAQRPTQFSREKSAKGATICQASGQYSSAAGEVSASGH
ncbi:hypothetical protein FRX31_008272 [Thalictrum thalictroides]|uniref:Uncharacterized protein n=1 Tax=Thalictrum thalictroides TaxID=46969 RepID=A0A7J6WXG5_THATH|nr:hypothetical protein FRX31_008272 [Thalictrum thalictroides]